MPRCVCAVFDHSEDYVTRFSGYIKKCATLPFTLYAFTQTEALEDFLRKEKTDLLLIPDGTEKETLKLAGTVKKLSKADTETVILGDKRYACCSLRYVDKYQSMEGIISEIIEILSEKEKLDLPAAAKAAAEITGIYSFGYLDRAVNFAFDLVQHSFGQKKALYINMTRFSGLEKKLDEAPQASVSDVIYCFLTKSGKLRGAYFRARGRKGNTDVILAPADPEDIRQIGKDMYSGFLDALCSVSGADHVILDLTEGFDDLLSSFDLCSRVWIICSRERDADRLAELKEYISGAGREDLLDKIQEADL